MIFLRNSKHTLGSRIWYTFQEGIFSCRSQHKKPEIESQSLSNSHLTMHYWAANGVDYSLFGSYLKLHKVNTLHLAKYISSSPRYIYFNLMYCYRLFTDLARLEQMFNIGNHFEYLQPINCKCDYLHRLLYIIVWKGNS